MPVSYLSSFAFLLIHTYIEISEYFRWFSHLHERQGLLRDYDSNLAQDVFVEKITLDGSWETKEKMDISLDFRVIQLLQLRYFRDKKLTIL